MQTQNPNPVVQSNQLGARNAFGGGNRQLFGRGLFGAILFFLLAPSLWATTSVTGTIQNLGTGGIGTSGAFVRFWLRGCAGNQPRVNGTAVIGPSQGGVFFFDLAANASGAISGTIYSTRDNTGNGNGDIECGGSKVAVWYGMQIFVSGKGGPEIPVHAKSGSSLDITQVTPITTNPVIAAPTGDGTYLRIDGGNAPVTGNVPFVASGAFADGAMSDNLTSLVNGLSPLQEFQATQGSHTTTDGFIGGVLQPATSTQFQVNGVTGYVQNKSNGGAGVAIYGQGRCNSTFSGARCWGANFVAANILNNGQGNSVPASLFGIEVDVAPGSSSDGSIGVSALFNSSTLSNVSGGTGFLAGGNNTANGIKWTTAFGSQDAGASSFASIGAACSTGTCASQVLSFRSFNSNALVNSTIQTDPGGDIQLLMPANKSLTIQANNGIELQEGSAPSLGGETIWGDATSHRLKMSNNAGSPDFVVGAATTDTLTNKTLTSPALTTPTMSGVTNGTGLQLFNTSTTCTTGASIGATCTTGAITLPVAYSDTNYRLGCIGLGPTNVPIVQTVAKSNTTFTITIAALTAAAATFTSYDCSAVHN